MTCFPCAAVLFDLDGVLVDSTELVGRRWRIWLEENHLDPEAAMKLAHGRRTEEVVRLVAPHLDAAAEARKLEAREEAENEGVRVIPGALRLLSLLPAGRWGVVTSGTCSLAVSRLRHAGLPVPQVLVTADDVRRGKPDAEPYLKGAELLGQPPASCLVVEDAPPGIVSAHAAGMAVIAVPTTYPASALAQADAVAGGLSELQVRWSGGSDGDAAQLQICVP